MAEVEWTEGRGLRNGLPDPNWTHHLIVYPTPSGWVVRVKWGSTFQHLHYGESASFTEALEKACSQAIKNGCPEEWLPKVE